MAAARAQDAPHSTVITRHAFSQCAPYHVHVPLFMRLMPLIGVGTDAAMVSGGVWVPAAYRAGGVNACSPGRPLQGRV